MLARLRFAVERSRGRRYPEPDHPYRNAFQRDRDRVIHSRAFRRLEAKTQVFTAGLSDHFRNRLTHTIEVAQIARTLANVLGLDEDLTEALALAHDIGHPPFAHAGEEELNRQMQRFGEGFDHNLHALRIVESFEQRYARFPGLNLTFEVREGIVKHSHDFGPGERPEWDAYLPGLRPVLEAQLIDLADEVAYNSADLDDAFSAGLLTAGAVAECVPQYRAIYETVETQFPGATDRERFHEGLRHLIDVLVSGLIEGTVSRAEESGASDAEDVRNCPGRLAAFTPEAAETSRHLKRFLYEEVYASKAVEEERRRSVALIGELFRFFLDRTGRLPQPYAQQVESEPPHRVVCDYIAGMTDGFFYRTYRQMIGPVPGE
ncbi:MAG TPA: deoxyguanosinetriphosphate triphosphohydrolase [Candidatus Acidoferrales bacterium]|jgi:dGTPase|nr:deoxyguanosinetriphosphate triphosphohydrolase [Candidatus Acidoferrales bacterium]